MAKFKSSHAGYEELLRGSGVQGLVNQHTQRLVSAAGRGYYGDGQQGKSRFRGIVYADTFRAMRDNAKRNTLVKVLGGG